MAYSSVRQINDIFMADFKNFINSNNLEIKNREDANNAMKDFLNLRLNSNNPAENYEDINPDLAIWTYSLSTTRDLLPYNNPGYDIDKIIGELISENYDRISLENPEFANYIESNELLGKYVTVLKEEKTDVPETNEKEDSGNLPDMEEDKEAAIASLYDENTEEQELPVIEESAVNPVPVNEDKKERKTVLNRTAKFAKIAIPSALLITVLALIPQGGVNTVDEPTEQNTLTISEVTSKLANESGNTIENVGTNLSENVDLNESNVESLITYEDYLACKGYIENLMSVVESEDENYKTSKTSLSDTAAANIPLMGLMDEASNGVSVNEEFISGLQNDGYTVPSNVNDIAVENSALAISYMLVSHPNDIKLSDMVLGATDKEILDGLQDRYNAILNASDENECKKALFNLSEYEEKNCGKDGITHIIGNEVVGTVIPQVCANLSNQNGWNLITSVPSESYVAGIAEDGSLVEMKEESVNQITMIDNEGNEIIDSGISLTEEDLNTIRQQVAGGNVNLSIEGRGKFSSLSSNPDLNARFVDFGENSLGISSGLSVVK